MRRKKERDNERTRPSSRGSRIRPERISKSTSDAAKHLSKAQGDEGFAASLKLRTQAEADWAITTTYYAALHYLDWYFAQRHKNFTRHEARAREVALDANLRAVYRCFRKLMDYSRQARYGFQVFRSPQVLEARACLDSVKHAAGAPL